jgi:hypothetical protein
LSRNSIANADCDFVFARAETLGIDQTSESQSLTGVAHTSPVFSLFAKLFAILNQRVFHID